MIIVIVIIVKMYHEKLKNIKRYVYLIKYFYSSHRILLYLLWVFLYY